jgi:hypothetical protein
MTFLTREVLETDLSGYKLKGVLAINEVACAKKIIDSGDKKIFLACALQLAIIGYGNKKLGSVEVDDVVYDIREFLESRNVDCTMDVGQDLLEDDLTPRRIVRLFRYQIRDYIIQENIQSYLYRKYGEEGDDVINVFPGAEYLVESRVLAGPLLAAYANLDDRLGTRFTERAKSVLDARKVP